jgi:putative ABC transport system permease protein
LIIGAIIPSLLTVSSLSLNDSIQAYKYSQIEKNFGEVDAYIANNKSSLFFSFPLSQMILDNIQENINTKNILAVSENMGRLEKDNNFLEILIIAAKKEDFISFLGRDIGLKPGKVVISKDAAEKLSVNVNDNVTIHMSGGSKNLEVAYIGESGFLNYKGDLGQYPGTAFVCVEDYANSIIFPSKAYIDFVDVEKVNIEDLNLSPNLEIVFLKDHFLNSPINEALGYIMFSFNSFALLAGIILIIVFGNSLANEQEKNVGVLRILGLKRNKVMFIFFIQTLCYFGFSSIIGCILGSQIGKHLLKKLVVIANNLSYDSLAGFTLPPFIVSSKTIIIGMLIGIIIPLIIFIKKGIEITFSSPIDSLRKDIEEFIPHRSINWLSLILTLIGIVIIILFKELAILGLICVSLGIVIWFKNPYLNVCISILFMILSKTIFSITTNTLSLNFVFQRVALLVISCILFFTSIIPILKRLSKTFFSKRSLPYLLGFSYVERFPIRVLLLSLMFGTVIFGLIVIASVPSNLVKFVDSYTSQGLFGYNYIVVSNPIKNFGESQEIYVHEGINHPSKVNVAMLDSDLIVFVDDTFLETVSLPFEGNPKWREELKKPGVVIYGKFDADEKIPEKVDGVISSIFPLGGNIRASYDVIGYFYLNDVVIPIKYLTHVRNKPANIRGLEILLGNVNGTGIDIINKSYMSDFDYPIYLDDILKNVFNGIDNFISLTSSMLYLGLISGFSGLALYSFRSCKLRSRVIGTLIAIGAKSKDIIHGFMIENFTIVSIGSLIGLCGGYLVAKDLVFSIFKFMGSVTFYFPALKVTIIIILVYLISFFTLLIPSRQVSKISPAESMKELE